MSVSERWMCWRERLVGLMWSSCNPGEKFRSGSVMGGAVTGLPAPLFERLDRSGPNLSACVRTVCAGASARTRAGLGRAAQGVTGDGELPRDTISENKNKERVCGKLISMTMHGLDKHLLLERGQGAIRLLVRLSLVEGNTKGKEEKKFWHVKS
jgi:hypothetical protein